MVRVTISRRDTADTATTVASLHVQSFPLSPGIEVGSGLSEIYPFTHKVVVCICKTLPIQNVTPHHTVLPWIKFELDSRLIAALPPSLLVVLKNMPVIFDTTSVVATMLLMFKGVGDGTVVRKSIVNKIVLLSLEGVYHLFLQN